ncbi:MAG: LD-carboxypeptidase [Muribaculaceae bacterium]
MRKKVIFPAPLQPGDKVAIVSPASAIKPQYVSGACDALRTLGYEPVVGKHCLGKVGTYSGTEQERLHDFIHAIDDSQVKAVLCSRGGYGVVHLLHRLQPEWLAANAKWLIGFSDISALHAAMCLSGVASVHASMAKHLALFGVDNQPSQSLVDVLQGRMPVYNEAAHPYNRPGEAVGTLVGGNMAVLCALIGTSFNLLSRGDVLFIEDIGESVYKIERMLYQLKLSGVLARLKGLIVGRFTEYTSPDGNGETMEDMVKRMVAEYDYPVAFNFPVGHVDENMPLIEGAEVHLQVDADGTRLRFVGEGSLL